MAASALLVEYPPCHKARSSPEEWYQEFEALFLAHPVITAPYQVFNHMITQERINTRANPKWRETRLDEYATLKRMLCELQLRVSAEVAGLLRHTDLRERWLSGSVAFREKHALVGIAAACAISPNLNSARISCVRELRVSHLGNIPQAYLDLLNEIAPQDFSETPVEPQYISDPEWDRFRADHRDDTDELHKLCLGYILVIRNKLIAHALEFITYSALDLPLPRIGVFKASHSSEKAKINNPDAFHLLQKDAMIRAYGKDRYDEIEAEFSTAYKERKAEKVNGCWHCSKMEKTRGVFKKCGVCAKMGRDVLYCSRECQVADWKLEHKKICGKLLDYDTADKLSHTVRKPRDPLGYGFPPPAPGFKRPLPLLHQMQQLKAHPKFDYALTRSLFTNGEDTAIMFYPNPTHKARFRAHRDRAIHDGDRSSVALMCEYMLYDIEIRNAQDIRREKVVEQLSAEYAWSVDGLEEALGLLAQYRAENEMQGSGPALAYGDCMDIGVTLSMTGT